LLRDNCALYQRMFKPSRMRTVEATTAGTRHKGNRLTPKVFVLDVAF